MTSPTGRRLRAWVPTPQDVGEALLTLATTTLGLAVAAMLLLLALLLRALRALLGRMMVVVVVVVWRGLVRRSSPSGLWRS